jgi:hypothetical protein
LLAGAILLCACGADPALTETPGRMRVITVDRPAPALKAKWGDQHRTKLYAAVTWRSVAVWNYVTSIAYAAAVERAEYSRVISAPAETVASPPSARPTVHEGAGGSVWHQLAECESGGDWSISTGNGFYGGLQFTLSSWQAVGGSGLPNHASPSEQIARGQRLQAIQGWGAWPACASKLGLR